MTTALASRSGSRCAAPAAVLSTLGWAASWLCSLTGAFPFCFDSKPCRPGSRSILVFFRLLLLKNTLVEEQAEQGLREALTAPPRSRQVRRHPSYQPHRQVYRRR